MRLVTLNIRFGTAEDGQFAWPRRRTGLLRFLRDLDADVLCLQEALDFQVDDVAGELAEYGCVGVGRDDGARGGEFAPIFFRGHMILDSGTVWLSETPDEPGSKSWGARHPRICTWAAFGGLKICNLHLDHESEEARMRSVELVTRTLAADIVCGDFNATPEEACIAAMLAAGYRDLGGEDGTYNGFDENAADAPKIDYIFAQREWVGIARVVRKPLVSDHWAVIAKIE